MNLVCSRMVYIINLAEMMPSGNRILLSGAADAFSLSLSPRADELIIIKGGVVFTNSLVDCFPQYHSNMCTPLF